MPKFPGLSGKDIALQISPKEFQKTFPD